VQYREPEAILELGSDLVHQRRQRRQRKLLRADLSQLKSLTIHPVESADQLGYVLFGQVVAPGRVTFEVAAGPCGSIIGGSVISGKTHAHSVSSREAPAPR